MTNRVYDRQQWRALPRTACIVELLLGDAASPCRGLVHRHHVDPADDLSRTVECCAAHHSQLHAVLRALKRPRRRCNHKHPYPWGKEACERRLNAAA